MITGRQIRDARNLLGLTVGRVAQRLHMDGSTLRRAEEVDVEPAITIAQAARIQSMFEKRGIVFDDDGAGVSRKTGHPK